MTGGDLYVALAPVLAALTHLGVRHFVTGSIASSAHGVPRASIDADVVAELATAHATPLRAALGHAYYVPESRFDEAIRHQTSFSIIHLETMVKVDVFMAREEADRQALARVVRARMDAGFEIPVCSAEDSVLAKMTWFRRGGEVSERQWSDIVGLLRVANPLDGEYLRQGAIARGLADLLARAEAAARRP